MNMAESTSRITSIDVFKGILIVGIVIIHVIALSNPLSERSYPIYLECAYMGLMSFFLISGYFYRPDRSLKENLGKRSKQLLLALVASSIIFSFFIYIWMSLNGYALSLNDLVDAILSGLSFNHIGADPALAINRPICETTLVNYFMWAIFMAFLVFYPTAKYILSDGKRFIVAVVFMLVLQCIMTQYFRYTLPFSLHLVPMAVAMMYTGAFLAKFKLIERIDAIRPKDWKYWGPFFACLIAAVVLVAIFPSRCSFDLMRFGDYGGLSVFPFMLEALAMMVVYAYVSVILTKVPLVFQFFSYSGKHSLALAFLHGVVAKTMLVPFYEFDTASIFPSDVPTSVLVAVSILTVITILVGCLIRDYVQKWKASADSS